MGVGARRCPAAARESVYAAKKGLGETACSEGEVTVFGWSNTTTMGRRKRWTVLSLSSSLPRISGSPKMILTMLVTVVVCVLLLAFHVQPGECSDPFLSDREHMEALTHLRHGRQRRDVNQPHSLKSRDDGPKKLRRQKRQVLYFILNFLGEEAIRSYVKETKTEDIPGLMTKVGAEEVLYIVASLPPEEIMRVLTSIPPKDVLGLAARMTQSQLMQLLGYVPKEGLTKLTKAFNPDQLQVLVMMLPPEGIVNLTRTVPPAQAKKLLKSLSPEGIFNLTQSMSSQTLMDLMDVLPPDIVLELTKTLSPENLDKLLKSLPPEVLVSLITSLPPKIITQLIVSLPPGFVESFLKDLTPDQLKKMVESITAEQVAKLLKSFPVTHMPDVSSLLKPEMIQAVLEALPKDLVANLTKIISPEKFSNMIASVPEDKILLVMSSVSSDQMLGLVKSIPPDAIGRLVTAIPPSTLISLSQTLPVDLIVNLTISLAEDRKGMSQLMSAVMSPELLASFSGAPLPKDLITEIVAKLPDETIANVAAALPVKKAFNLFNSLPKDTPAVDVDKVLKEIPKNLVVKVANALPPQLIADISEKLTRSQLKKIVRSVTPEMVNLLMTSIPPARLVQIAQALSERVISIVLNVLPPKHFGKLVKAVPMDTIKALMDIVLTEDPVQHSPDLIVATTQKVANILLSVPQPTLTKLIKAIPRDVLLGVMNSLPPQAIADAAAIFSGEEGVPIASALPVEAIAHMLSVIPPEVIVKMVDALPQRTIGAFANMIMKVPQEHIEAFFRQIQVGALRNILIKLPPRTIEKMASSLPPGTLSKMVQNFSPVTVAPIMESLRPKELRRLIRSVNTTTLSNLLTSIPQDLLVNLTKAMPPEQIGKLMSAIPPELVNQLVSHLDPTSMVALMKAMPPSVIENVLNTLPTDLLVNMTKILPPAQMQELMDLLPGNVIGKMVGVLPKEVLVDLVQTFDADAMLNMMGKLSPEQLMDILATLPHQVVLNITKSQTPEQTMKLLETLPPDGIVNLTNVMPTDVMLEMMQSVPPEGLLNLIGSMPLKDLFTLANQLNASQMKQVMEQFSADPDLIPKLMASVDMERMMSMVEAVPPELLLSVAENIDMAMVLGLTERFMPKVQEMVLQKMDQALVQLGRNSTHTFQQCLADLGYVAHSMFDFRMWSFHFLDASGKPGRGMLEGNIHMIGNYDQCKKIQHVISEGERDGDVIAGSYCHVRFDVPMEALPPIPGDGILPMPEIAMDVCLPDTCQDFDLQRLLKTVKLPMNVTIPHVTCQKDMHLMDNPAAIIVCVVIAILVILVGLGTAADVVFLRRSLILGGGAKAGGDDNHNHNKYSAAPRFVNGRSHLGKSANGANVSSTNGDMDDDLMEKEKMLPPPPDADGNGMVEMEMKSLMKKNGGGESINDGDSSMHSYTPERVIHTRVGAVNNSVPDDRLWLQVAKAFSLPNSLSTLMSCSHAQGTISCLHGIRVVSMLWVIFANTVSFAALYFENLLATATDVITLSSQVILNSSLAQDSFFAVSGVVTAVTFLGAVYGCGRMKVVHIVRYYVHRFIRVSPAYMVLLAVCALLIGYITDGPHWPPPLQEQCVNQWWTNLLFINNYFVSVEHMCMSWTWFLANLMQFYWIAPLVLVPFAFRKSLVGKIVGFSVIGALVACHIVSTVLIELDINADILRRQSDYFYQILQQPYCRVAPFALGLGLGYILTQLQFRFYMHKAVALTGWLLAFATSTTLCLITYEENRYLLEDATGWSLSTRTVHETLQRPFWGLVVCWVIFACSTGNGGPINSVLSWKGFLPLSRLTYCVYLIHPVIMICDLFAYRVFAFFTISYVVFRYLGYVVASYFAALALSVLTETPVLALEKVIISIFRKP